jgi:hypothetical protein
VDLKTARDLETSPEVRKDRAFLACIILLLALLAYFFLPGLVCTFGGSLSCAREWTASSLISQLAQAAKTYELDFATFPPGDGLGSRGLARALQAPMKGPGYFNFGVDKTSDLIARDGNIRNPVHEEKIIYYRFPGIHNPKAFDLWCEDAKGRADGINNWSP